MVARNGEDVLNTRSFEYKWVIKNWKGVVHNKILTEKTYMEFILEAEDIAFARFLVGTSAFQKHNNCVGFYWKLLSKHEYLHNVQAELATELLHSSGKFSQISKIEENAVIGQVMKIRERFWSHQNPDSTYADFVNPEGSLEIKLTFTLKCLSDFFEKEFFRTTRDKMCQNLAALLNDEVNSDVYFFTKDKIKLSAHKTIFVCFYETAQCPVFASMFGYDFTESTTGTVQVDDISAKTMKILLHYWYTGALLPSWRDDDTVVEVTYAAGKYQMDKILKMIDGVIGHGSYTAGINVELLRLAQNLPFKNAEGRILQQVIREISQSVSGTELLEMFYHSSNLLDGETFGAEEIAKIWDNASNENDERKASYEDIKMMEFASKLGLKNIEKQLLERVMDAVSKVDSADELFAIFDLRNEERSFVMTSEGPKSTKMVVRAPPK